MGLVIEGIWILLAIEFDSATELVFFGYDWTLFEMAKVGAIVRS
jgi:hypothetical protein